MLITSKRFKNAMKQPVKELQAYIYTDTVRITDADDLISIKVSCDSGMCKTAMRKLEAKFTGDYNLLGDWVHVGYGVKVDNGTYEYLDYGSFLVNEIDYIKDTGVTTIVAYDKMINSMVEYQKLDIEYPVKLLDYTKALCRACNLDLYDMTASVSVDINNGYLYAENLTLELDSDTGCLISYETDLELIDGCLYGERDKHSPLFDILVTGELWENISGITYRDIFQQIAQATGTTCIVSNDDNIYFKQLKPTGETLTYDNMFKLKLEEKYGEINSVVLSRTPQEDNIYKRDEESIRVNGLTEFKIENNELIDKDRESVINQIYDVLYGISYYPFETTTEGLGWYEVGDKLDIVNDNGDVFNTALFNYSINIDGGIQETLKTTAETKTQTQYQYATTISKRVKNTEIIVNKQEQYIESIVSDINDEDGVINSKFTKVYQDIDKIVNNIQTSGGNNLLKNSVMFAYDGDVVNDWNILHGSKNIANITMEQGAYGFADGVTYTYSNYIRTSEAYDVVPGETYTLSFKGTQPTSWDSGFVFFKDGEYVSCLAQQSLTFTVPNGVNQVAYNLCKSEGIVPSDIYDIQLEPGDKATTYEAYKEGQIIIDSNTESLNAGCLSGHGFTLLNKKATQKVLVDTGSIYSFSTRVKKAKTGTAYIKLYNSNEEYVIDIPNSEEVYYKEFELRGLQPKDNYYIVELYGSTDSEATFTDNMFNLGEYKSQWTQANGEIMNTQVNVNINGVLVKSSIYQGDYTIMSPLEFAGYSNINGTITKVFSLNKDVTLVKKLEAEDEIKMTPIKIVPITEGDLQGWAFVPST